MDYEELYRTKDFEKALILSASDCFWEATEANSNGVITFVFEDKNKCLETWRKHRQGNLEVSTSSLLSSYRNLKRVLHNK